MEEGRRALGATPEEVIERLKADGTFDALRLKIINEVKQNEELRNYVISEVAQSQLRNRGRSKNKKPTQLSDAVYKELGKKVTGRISDEIWKVIKSGSTSDDITKTVESVYNGILDPNSKEEGPSKQLPQLPSEEEFHKSMNLVDDADDMPPGFAVPLTSAGAVKVSPGTNAPAAAAAADMPPGFTGGAGVGSVGGAGMAGVDGKEDGPVAPPGFG